MDVQCRYVEQRSNILKGAEMRLLSVVIVGSVLMLSGCSMFRPHAASGDRVVVSAGEHVTKLTAIGYGSASSIDRSTEGQRRLMAMRASKLDAYRALAEQIYGVRVTGNSTVASMAMQNESFRVYIDAYIRGARISNVNQLADGNYETTVEMDFDEALVRSYASQAPRNPELTGSRGGVGPGPAYGATYYYSD
jgi:outer membrane protein FlgP